MRHPAILSIALPGVLFMLAACEPEQEGTPLDPAETRQQEEPVTVEDGEAVERQEPGSGLHVANGTVVSVDPANQQITINHGRVKSLGWPEMTMPFQVTDPAVLEDIEPDARIEFVFREAPEGHYVVEEIRPQQGGR